MFRPRCCFSTPSDRIALNCFASSDERQDIQPRRIWGVHLPARKTGNSFHDHVAWNQANNYNLQNLRSLTTLRSLSDPRIAAFEYVTARVLSPRRGAQWFQTSEIRKKTETHCAMHFSAVYRTYMTPGFAVEFTLSVHAKQNRSLKEAHIWGVKRGHKTSWLWALPPSFSFKLVRSGLMRWSEAAKK